MPSVDEYVTNIERETGEPVIELFSIMERFSYESGYLLECIDLGLSSGVKIVLSHPQYDEATILLDNETTTDLAFWLLKTMGQKIPSLPNKLPITIKSILDQKGMNVKLKRGDKKIFEQTMNVLREILYHKELKKIKEQEQKGTEHAKL
jgi:hypothetical protein